MHRPVSRRAPDQILLAGAQVGVAGDRLREALVKPPRYPGAVRRDELIQELVDELVHDDSARARAGATDLPPDDVDLMLAQHREARGVRMKERRERLRHRVPVGMDMHEEHARRHARKDLPQADQLRTDHHANGVDHFGRDHPAPCDDLGFTGSERALSGRRAGRRICRRTCRSGRLITTRQQQDEECDEQSGEDTWQEHARIAS